MLLCVQHGWAQSTKVRGRVTDSKTGLPLSYVNVSLKGTTSGTVTDENGVYSIESREAETELVATCLGYKDFTTQINRGKYNEVNIALTPTVYEADEVVVKANVNPALLVLEEVVKHRNQNDPDRYNRFICKTYTKMQLDLNNMKRKFSSDRLQRNFGFIFDYMDTSAFTGKPALPVMISETVADFYHSRNPKIEREVILANRVSGVENTSSVAQFTGRMHINVNFYDKFIDLMDVNFAGPIALYKSDFYEYTLSDSLYLDGRLTLKIIFRPKRVVVPVFEGELYIDDATYGLVAASAKMARGINVNWVNNLQLECKNQYIESIGWFRHTDKATVEFSIDDSKFAEKYVSFLGTRQITYSDVRIDEEIPQDIADMDYQVGLVKKNVSNNDEAYWDKVRPYKLSEREAKIYEMVDAVQNVPLYQNIYTILNTIFTGYYNTKYIGIGPYLTLLSHNDLEGFRGRIGARTRDSFSETVRLEGYVAYGLDDKKYKGGGSVELVFGSNKLTRKLFVAAKHDVMQLGTGENALTESNILSTIMSRGSQRLTMVDRLDLNYEHEINPGKSLFIGGNVQKVFGNEFVPMTTSSGNSVEYVKSQSASIGFRYAIDENIVRTTFDRYNFGSPYPVFTLNGTYGNYSVAGRKNDYARVDLIMDYDWQLPPIGVSNISFRAGKIFGQVPYPLLKLHEGNNTYMYDPYTFSCMNYYEFASDQWLTLFYEHHFNGWIFGRLPLLKKTNWREVITCKAAWGGLSPKNSANSTTAMLRSPEGMTSLEKPYVEMGVGVENIFKFLRFDFIWRMTHREHKSVYKIDKYALNVSLQLKF